MVRIDLYKAFLNLFLKILYCPLYESFLRPNVTIHNAVDKIIAIPTMSLALPVNVNQAIKKPNRVNICAILSLITSINHKPIFLKSQGNCFIPFIIIFTIHLIVFITMLKNLNIYSIIFINISSLNKLFCKFNFNKIFLMLCNTEKLFITNDRIRKNKFIYFSYGTSNKGKYLFLFQNACIQEYLSLVKFQYS